MIKVLFLPYLIVVPILVTISWIGRIIENIEGEKHIYSLCIPECIGWVIFLAIYTIL